jgi:hypothetical protein
MKHRRQKLPRFIGEPHTQTGKTTVDIDARLYAMYPGWRISKSGNKYYEARKNRSDAKGKKV